MAYSTLVVFFLGVFSLETEFILGKIHDANAPKVGLELYYESLCPYSQDFIVKQLYPAYQKVPEIFNFMLIPYGKASESLDGQLWKFQCQHGKEECIGNIIETCAIAQLNASGSLPFVYCIEKNIDGNDPRPLAVAKQCAKDVGMNFSSIDACQSGPLGNNLEHVMALKTEALEPKLRYVPWITLNGKHTEKIQDKAQDNLLKLLCEYYTGTKPPACQNLYAGKFVKY